jgi:NADH-quinone oxidoreductase subunit A
MDLSPEQLTISTNRATASTQACQPIARRVVTLTSQRFSLRKFNIPHGLRRAFSIHFRAEEVWWFNGDPSMNPYFPLVITFAIAAVVILALLLIASKVGPKSNNPAKAEPFESGNPPRGDARMRFSVRFYLIAMLFLIFDLEVVFLYPWAIYFRRLGIIGLVQMGIFLVILTIGYIYVWKKGALDWD